MLIKKGDLVYIPSKVTLITKDYKTFITEKPITVLITCVSDQSYEVLYRGSRWTVSSRDIYPIGPEEIKNVNNAHRSS